MSANPPRILIIDDESTTLDLLEMVLREFAYDPVPVSSGQEGIERYGQGDIDLVIVDMAMPRVDGLEVIRRLRTSDPEVEVIVMTGSASVDAAVKAMKCGAFDFLTKPLDLENLQLVLNRALEKKRQAERFRELEDSAVDGADHGGILGRSPAIAEVFRMVRRVATTSVTVLVRGESGTGKELVARAIHAQGSTQDRPFYTINCASIPVNLMESELFGHERGAFTDAKSLKKGLLELADGGTLFLDEVGLMSLDLQAKLLNVFETLRFRRVGGTENLEVAVRFVLATNEDLEVAVQDGRFREDLYYRLNVVPIHLPPLRERGDDILLIAEHYVRLYASLHDVPQRRFTDDARALLLAYPWPGNVRELRNVIERAVLMTDVEEISAAALAIDRRSRRRSDSAGDERGGIVIDTDGVLTVRSFPEKGLSLVEVEKQLIQETLRHTDGNVSRAAALLHTSRDVIRYRIAKYGLETDA